MLRSSDAGDARGKNNKEKIVSRVKSKLLLVALMVASMSALGFAAEPEQGEAPSGEPQRTEVLSDNTLLRTWMVFRTPVVIGKDGEFQ